MAKKTISDKKIANTLQRAPSPDLREMQVIAAAYDLAEQRIKDGTASDTLLREFVKLGSPKEQIEREILEKQRDLITAKTEAINAQKKVDELYSEALSAFKTYHGDGEDGSEIF